MSMPKFTIEHATQRPLEDTFKNVKKFLQDDQELRKFDSDLKVEFQDDKMQCSIRSSKFKSDIHVIQDSTEKASKVTITVDLPLILSPFKSQISETLKRKLIKYLS